MAVPHRVFRIALSVFLAGLLSASVQARGTGAHGSGPSSGSYAGKSNGTSHPSKSKKAKGSNSGKSESTVTGATRAGRDSHGRIARNEAAKHEFEVQSGYPHGRPGYVVDHIKPLACGGADVPSNMQWQTVEAAKAKDATERMGCR